jgi:hypothetical protein
MSQSMNHLQRQQLARVGFNAWLFCGPISSAIKEQAQEMNLQLSDDELERVINSVNYLITNDGQFGQK